MISDCTIHLFLQIYTEHPLRTKAFYCDIIENATDGRENYTSLQPPSFSTSTERTSYKVHTTTVINDDNQTVYTEKVPHRDAHEEYKRMHHYSENFNEPNTALLSTILIFGTFLIAYFLRIFRNSKFLGRSVSI